MEFKEHEDYSKELEAGVLGACLLEKTAFGRTFGLVDKDAFYFDGNKAVYDALATMYSNGAPIDLLTVCDFLINVKGVKEISGFNTAYYITKLTNEVVSTAHLEYHSLIIKRMWMGRELTKLTHGSLRLEGNVKDRIAKLNEAIQNINQATYEQDWNDPSEIMYGLMKHQDKMKDSGGMGIATGFDALDKETGGFFNGNMIVIGARPSVGKSALAGQMALSMAHEGVKVGIISLEMNNNEIGARLASIETGEDFKTIFRNLFRDENQRAAWYEKVKRMINLPLYITDKTQVNALDIKAKATKLKHLHGLDILIIDYLQLVNPADESARNRTRENEVAKISRTIKLMAKELDIPVIILCQLNRQSTHRQAENRYPYLSDLRESGAIEQDADVVIFLHRDYLLGEKYMVDENGASTKDQADLIVRKWRNAESQLHLKLRFDGQRMKFLPESNQVDFWKPEDTNFNEDNPF